MIEVFLNYIACTLINRALMINDVHDSNDENLSIYTTLRK